MRRRRKLNSESPTSGAWSPASVRMIGALAVVVWAVLVVGWVVAFGEAYIGPRAKPPTVLVQILGE